MIDSTDIQVIVTNPKRIWCDVTVHWYKEDSNGETYGTKKTKVRKSSVITCNIPFGQPTRTKGVIIADYGADSGSELVL